MWVTRELYEVSRRPHAHMQLCLLHAGRSGRRQRQDEILLVHSGERKLVGQDGTVGVWADQRAPFQSNIYTCTFSRPIAVPRARGRRTVSHVSAFLKVRMAMHGCCVSVRSVIRDVQYIDRVVECWRCGRGWAARRRALGAPSAVSVGLQPRGRSQRGGLTAQPAGRCSRRTRGSSRLVRVRVRVGVRVRVSDQMLVKVGG